MIPPFAPDQTQSKAERTVFQLLKNDISTHDWIAFHSLALSQDKAFMPYGEIDFVVLIPDFGLICLEVKGGGISVSNGTWATTDARGIMHPLRRSPFVQARDSMFMLRKRLEEAFKQANRKLDLKTSYVVLFPDCQTPPMTSEFTVSEVIDSRELTEQIGNAIRRCLKGKFLPARMPESDFHFVKKLLRPDFERPIMLSTILKNAERTLCAFTEEQVNRLEELEDNERCLFDGPAGTGKTVLAMQAARKFAAEGHTTLLTCYNKLLSESISSQTRHTENLKVSSFWSLLASIIAKSSIAAEYNDKSHRSTFDERKTLLTEYGALAIAEFDITFDRLVIDEAQDLSTSENMEIFDLLLKGGLKNGHWVMFGDYTQQSLFDENSAIENVRSLCSDFTSAKIRTNCRNTKQIISATSRLSLSNDKLYKGTQADGPDVVIDFFKNDTDQVDNIQKTIEKFLDDGINSSEIIILSPSKLANSCLKHAPGIGKYRLIDLTNTSDPFAEGAFLRFCTVQAFKGLESKVILLIDIRNLPLQEIDPILYVGMTRARSHLTIFCAEKNRTLGLLKLKGAQ